MSKIRASQGCGLISDRTRDSRYNDKNEDNGMREYTVDGEVPASGTFRDARITYRTHRMADGSIDIEVIDVLDGKLSIMAAIDCAEHVLNICKDDSEAREFYEE